MNRAISVSSNNDDGHDDDDCSTLGDESEYVRNSIVNKDDPYNFLAQQHLDESSSDESSYWSNSSEEEDSDDDDDDSDSDESLQHQGATDNEYASEGDGIEVKRESSKKRVQRSTSSLSIDAIIKLKMSMAKKDAKPSVPSVIPREVAGIKRGVAAGAGGGGGAAEDGKAQPRRRNRRLTQERQTLGSLAKKLGSSTGNEISPDVKEKIMTLKRSESSSKLRVRPKRMVHIQQEGNTQKPKNELMDASLRKSTSTAGAAAGGVNAATAIKKAAKYGEHAKKLVKPREHYEKILRNENVVAPMVSYDRLEDFLLPITAEDKAAFDMALVGAVRDQNLDKVKELKAQGHPLQARSQFGESLLHVCARRGTPEMLRFMLQQEEVSVRTTCDYGRTPLHDAAWSADAKSLEMMKILIQECPDLLLILDKRGFMPLDYIPKERWPHACSFLDKYKSMILPTGVIFGEESSSEEDSDGGDSDEESSEEESDDE